MASVLTCDQCGATIDTTARYFEVFACNVPVEVRDADEEPEVEDRGYDFCSIDCLHSRGYVWSLETEDHRR